MLISHKHKFIFVHVWKTGGNSVRNVLEPHCENLIQQTRSSLFHKFFQVFSGTGSPPHAEEKHLKFSDVKKHLEPEIFKEYFKFAFVRNPLSWEVSFYHFITQKHNQHPRRDLIRGLGSFEEYIKWSAEHEMIRHMQKPFVYDSEGYMLADFLGKYEFLQQDFEAICQRIGIGNVKLEKINSSKHDAYMRYYSSETETLVRQILKEDFETFGYT